VSDAVIDTVAIVCANCDAVNRIPKERLADGAKAVCGRCKNKLFQGHPIVLDDPARFQKHVERSSVPVLVDFWAAWCGPCLAMAPEFEKAAQQLEPRARLAKVDTEKAGTLAARYGIRALPTMILFKEGREVGRQSGAVQAPGIVRFVESHIAS
jgi:thioredoxin 2